MAVLGPSGDQLLVPGQPLTACKQVVALHQGMAALGGCPAMVFR